MLTHHRRACRSRRPTTDVSPKEMLLEMSRDPAHGGAGWEFGKCVWSPTEKGAGGDWPFWSKVGAIKNGDLILHLQGIHPHAYFVGFSIAASDGYRTSDRPPILGQWEFATHFFRADLEDFNPFPEPIPLTSVFQTRDEELRHYFKANKALSKSTKKNLFTSFSRTAPNASMAPTFRTWITP